MILHEYLPEMGARRNTPRALDPTGRHAVSGNPLQASRAGHGQPANVRECHARADRGRVAGRPDTDLTESLANRPEEWPVRRNDQEPTPVEQLLIGQHLSDAGNLGRWADVEVLDQQPLAAFGR